MSEREETQVLPNTPMEKVVIFFNCCINFKVDIGILKIVFEGKSVSNVLCHWQPILKLITYQHFNFV